MNKSILVGLAAAAALFLTNPTRDDFGQYLEKRMEKDTAYKSDVGAFFGNLLTDGLAELIVASTERKDFGLFSIYRIGGKLESEGNSFNISFGNDRNDGNDGNDEDDGGDKDEDNRYLGILGQFMAL
jgi:hypothetical protein